ncbi:LysR family transcriptional regulator [Mesorhizobium sp. M8A.F.Ca.ET.208.01.1.1]|uniref:LysR substrate-binding domain-containing protein n=1 Tax=unclassified Mesorhizobium TaxID=325217 RepID=UPI000F76124C|nr:MULTISPECIES: LysR substrate-binding domain-containing protein [unclassified Mesorhizobium]RUX09031.1 LysR family transcriptional regulator [Mesorhizobium sp. M8A.F.Ca.ET.059.01.1.1]AZO54357.1 LysR family transcriptional regulator [Mesorhizobium sp. M8A.F.Ca.ET.057.01.1.1]RWE49797.1 MAG: LysR family transcriptional regulator [Mesorhizobium sp.]TGQ94527.1 LysR family transcriptional regulator [Mesorhizobium sp. M8A.F.Ca.ET.208.01.1.1]TGT55015.1 LysR family transcriptional regulator [Mesorhiz
MSRFPRRFLPSSSALTSFEAAARHESFTLAAEELHLTQSAISRQVKELELTIGTKLFRRVGRHVVLTDAGRSLATELCVDLENIQRTVMRAISAGGMGAALRIATLPAFANSWLIPRLPDFFARHSGVELSLFTRLEPFDMTRERFDLAIHFGVADWPDTDMKPLCSESLVPVASPAFKHMHGIEDISDLARSPLLHLSTRPIAWKNYFEQAGLVDNHSLAGKYFDQFSMVISAAKASLGAGLIPSYLVEEELRSGSIIEISKISMVTSNNYYLVTPVNQRNKNVIIFSDWITSCARETIL